MYQAIIVPIDPGDYATTEFGPARRLSYATGAEIILIGEPGVVEHHRGAFATTTPTAHRYLTARESPEEAVADVVASRGPEDCLVVVATHARNRLGYAVAGSTAEAIIRASHANVMLVGPDCNPGWFPDAGPLGLCLDHTDLAEQAIPIAQRWAETHGNPVELLRVTTPAPPLQSALGPAGGYPIDPYSGASTATITAPPRPREFGGQAKTYLDGHANLLRARGIDAISVVHEGHRTAAIITDHLRTHDSCLAIMTTHGRSGVGRVILGSTMVAVARHAPCPVLTAVPVDDQSHDAALS